MNVLIETLLDGWERAGHYGHALVNDLSQEQMIIQPLANMNHPSWVLSHLGVYQVVLLELLTGRTPEDPWRHKYGMKSKPEQDSALYLPKDELLASWTKNHADVADAMRNAPESLYDQTMPLERWRKNFPKIGSVLGFIMLTHEALHLGQLSAWRRTQGLPSVAIVPR